MLGPDIVACEEGILSSEGNSADFALDCVGVELQTDLSEFSSTISKKFSSLDAGKIDTKTLL